MNIELYNGDCLIEMNKIADKSVDMILADLPYGTTSCKWDIVIPFEPLWKQYKRIIKDNGAIVLFGSEPFSSYLRMSNIQWYKYDWIWKKSLCSNFLNLKKQPSKIQENISVFYKKQPTYNPQMREGLPYIDKGRKEKKSSQQNFGVKNQDLIINNGERYPESIIAFKNGNNKNLHPTQKPVALLEYLIKTYTNENETVLDNTMGSGSTGVACKNTGRHFIGIEQDKKYFEIAKARINDVIIRKVGGNIEITDTKINKISIEDFL